MEYVKIIELFYGDIMSYCNDDLEVSKNFVLSAYWSVRGREEKAKYYEKRVPNYCKKLKNRIIETLKEDLDDDFFSFESEEIDSEIDKMHFNEAKKISAKEYMSVNSLDLGIINDIEESEEDFENLRIEHSSIDEIYLNKLIKIVENYLKIFIELYDFKEIGYSLKKFKEKLNGLNLDNIKIDNLVLLKSLFESVVDDLNSFKKAVLVDQDAIDIHYLDASLLANLVQIEISIDSFNESGYEDNRDDLIEFF